MSAREVDSLLAAYQQDLADVVKDLPRVAEAVDRAKEGDEPGAESPAAPTPEELEALNSKVLWMLARWIGTLAQEVDRLAERKAKPG